MTLALVSLCLAIVGEPESGLNPSHQNRGFAPGVPAAITANTLVSMPPASLVALYRSASVANLPQGPIAGRLVSLPGTRLGRWVSRGGRLVWQGKIIHADGTATNRFFGLPLIRGRLAVGPSWYDGAPTLILDYEQTSMIYRRYRDEIRQVTPGLYLGLMFDRTKSPPRLTRFFALQE
jgi:hypothetical protein